MSRILRKLRCWCSGHDDILILQGFYLECVSCGRISKGFHHERR